MSSSTFDYWTSVKQDNVSKFSAQKAAICIPAFFIGDRDTEAEVWLRFWSWSFADFDQLVIWLKSGYFGESTQPLGLLCLEQLEHTINYTFRELY